MNPRRRRIKRRRRRERREQAAWALEALAHAYDFHDSLFEPEDDNDEYGLFFITFGDPFS